MNRKHLALLIVGAISAALIAATAWTLHRQSERVSRAAEIARKFPATKIPLVPEQRNIAVPALTALKINASRPYDVTKVEAAGAFTLHDDTIAQDRAISCLAAAAWYEAGDDAEGEKSVIQTVLNRVRHPAFPSTVCGVVFQGQERETGCQFSFTCDGALKRTPSDDAWQRAVTISRAMLSGQVFAPVGYATHYHTDWVVPYWSPELTKLAKVRTHIFYVWPGFWGTKGAFRQKVGSVEPIVPALARLSSAHATVLETDVPPITEKDTQQVTAIAEPPAIIMPGISQRSMHGSVVRAAPEPNVYFVEVENRDFPGNFAISALAVCKNKPTCRFYGWTDRTKIAERLPLTSDQQDMLSFYYERASDGSDKALWNCRQVVRKNPSQCLPVNDPPDRKVDAPHQ